MRREVARIQRRPGLLALVALIACGLPLSGQKSLRTYRSKESIVKSNAPAKTSKAVSKRIDKYCEIYEDFYEGLGMKAKNDNKIAVRLFSTHAEFEERYKRNYPGRNVPAAYFSPSANALFIYDDEASVSVRATLMHECSHQFMNRYAYKSPKWLNEGLAEYFEGLRLSEEGELIEKRPALFDLLLVQSALRGAGNYLQPETLVGMSNLTFDQFPPDGSPLHSYMHYATAWSLAWYCLEGGHEADRQLYVDTILATPEEGEEATLAVADWYAFEQRWKEFILALEPALETSEDYLLVADGHYQSKAYDVAVEHYLKALELDPDYPGLHMELGRAAYLGDLNDVAREHLTIERERVPKDPTPLYWLAGLAFYVDGDHAGALELAEEASKLAKHSVPRYLDFVADCHLKLGDKRAALRALKKILDLVEDDEEDLAYYELRIEDVRKGK